MSEDRNKEADRFFEKLNLELETFNPRQKKRLQTLMIMAAMPHVSHEEALVQMFNLGAACLTCRDHNPEFLEAMTNYTEFLVEKNASFGEDLKKLIEKHGYGN